MTEVVTISAATAALAAEPLKPSARVSGTTPLEASIQALSDKASASDDPRQKILMNLVHPPALALFFLTTSQDQRPPQLTQKQAEEEYLLNGGEEDVAAETDMEDQSWSDAAGDDATGLTETSSSPMDARTAAAA